MLNKLKKDNYDKVSCNGFDIESRNIVPKINGNI